MSFFSFIHALAALVGIASAEPPSGMTVTRIIEHDEITLRIPVQPRPMGPTIQFIERPGPRCINPDKIVGAALSGSDSVDFIMKGHRRYRAEIDNDCDGLDFYGGFYLQPDGPRLCAGRDEIRSRIGGSCRIEQFREVVPRIVR